MYSIIYYSTAQPYLEEADIEKLLQQTETDNNARRVSGILVFKEGNFFQILECPTSQKEELIALFEKIKNDPRHYNVIKVVERHNRSRLFETYKSSFTVLLNPSEIKGVYNYLKMEKEYNPEGYSEVAYLTQKFLALI
ncbi:BLUF domain-containing protein [Aureisphaera galaxeae]|uniref:BLUF domain-containing protein n=1 Tax=Aureisphaera galaxeae TaxID=1538023 RepID=UPI002350E12A|nr:BLUF domain-containing protein [Aureisphaera galaxeae]MDC8003233.1 BLUF domain-containing protein [Aureisphaera galaxeae]